MTATATMVEVVRPTRGSRVSSFYPVKSVPALSALDSAFQLQEYISLLIRLDIHDVDTIVSLPSKILEKEKASGNLSPPEESDAPKFDEKDAERKSDSSVDRACWIYEQLRRLAQDLSHPLITMLQQECTRTSCPEMKAGEWLYLCVAHGSDGAMEQCCAIDYILHTLDSATALLNSPRAFPSRLQIPQASQRHFTSLARRLGRIFAHAYFHHREAFEQAEVESSLYDRFVKLTEEFDLVPADFLVIPSRAVARNSRLSVDEVSPPRLLAASISPIREDKGQQEVCDPLHDGTDPGRRFGRSRTDTMVFNEVHNVAEELARGESSDQESSSSNLESLFEGGSTTASRHVTDAARETIYLPDADAPASSGPGDFFSPVSQLKLGDDSLSDTILSLKGEASLAEVDLTAPTDAPRESSHTSESAPPKDDDLDLSAPSTHIDATSQNHARDSGDSADLSSSISPEEMDAASSAFASPETELLRSTVSGTSELDEKQAEEIAVSSSTADQMRTGSATYTPSILTLPESESDIADEATLAAYAEETQLAAAPEEFQNDLAS